MRLRYSGRTKLTPLRRSDWNQQVPIYSSGPRRFPLRTVCACARKAGFRQSKLKEVSADSETFNALLLMAAQPKFHSGEHWAKQKEALLGRKARRSTSPLEFIMELLSFVAKETHAERAVLYLFDEDAPSLTSLQERQFELEAQSELVATANWGFSNPKEIVHRAFLPTKVRSRAAAEFKRMLPSLGRFSIETIPFFSAESRIGGIIAIYAICPPETLRQAKLRLKPVLNETSIIVDFVLDRFLQQDLVRLNQFGLKSANFDSRDGMCRMIEETRKLLGCEGLSFFERDTTTDDETFWLATMNILLLDDDTQDVPEIVDVWRLQGYSVYQVVDWRKLDDVLKEQSFDAVLIDLMIPAIDLPVHECAAGFTTGEYIYRVHIFPKLPNTPFAVFSAALFDLDVIKAATERLSTYSGYRGYFEKGCSNDAILKAISK